MGPKSNLLLDVLNEIPENEAMELAVKCWFYKNLEENIIEYTGNYDDSVEIDGDKKNFGPLQFYHAGAFLERLLNKFKHLDFDEREHAFLFAIGIHLHIRFEDWENEIKRLEGSLNSQAKSYESKLKEWRENHKQLTTAYNDLHYQYKQLKKKVDEKEMDCTKKTLEETASHG